MSFSNWKLKATSIFFIMFSDYSRPFYQSAEILYLEKLDPDVYANFVLKHFLEAGVKIHSDEIVMGIDWAANHTFYVQFLFNTLWGAGVNPIQSADIREIQKEIIVSRNVLYINFRNLLTGKQYALLKAVGIEDNIQHPNAEAFISKHHLGSVSTVNSALKVLVEKELIYRDSKGYQLYDVFQRRWFQMN